MSQIQIKFASLLAGGLNLGLPASPEEQTFDNGSKQRFQAGVIYFHPRLSNAFECHGLILQTYIQQGEEKSTLGYPVSDEQNNPAVFNGRLNYFENGTIFYSPVTGISIQYNAPAQPNPRIVVKIAIAIPINLGPNDTISLDQLALLTGPPGLSPAVNSIRLLFPAVVFRKLFNSVNPVDLQDLIVRAQQNDPTYQPPNFQNYLLIECPAGFVPGPLVAALKLWFGVVESAHISIAIDPFVVGTSNSYFNQQSYLKPAPMGIGIQSAWAKGADGANVRFIDIEQSWSLVHEDLPQNIHLIDGQIRPWDHGHGTAVLGVISAIDNTLGVVGIAPAVTTRIISAFTVDMAEAILLATLALSPGDVILLEFTVGGEKPAEFNDDVFEAIRLSTKSGVIVVEAAGNKNLDLDALTDDNGKHILNRNLAAEFQGDSGAIMVGACHSANPHIRWVSSPNKGSNFGSRIDCHAWGENVFTTGIQGSNPPPNSYFNFSGTSSASAIIAGVCIIIQDLQRRIGFNPGFPLAPNVMRQIVSDFANGTDSPSNHNGPFLVSVIGPMPDMKKILSNFF